MLPRSHKIKKLLRFGRPFRNRDQLILRDHLALERTRLANERTFMAYTRSSLYLIIGGLALLQLTDYGNLEWVGIIALSLAGIFAVIGVVRFYQLKRQLASYYVPMKKAQPTKEEDAPDQG